RAAVFGMFVKKFAERLDLLQWTLYVVQPLHGEDDTLSDSLLAERVNSFVGFGAFADAPDVVHVYAYGLGAEPDRIVAHGDLLGHLVDAECAAVGKKLFGCIDTAKHFGGGVAFDHIHKVFYVSRNVEADEIALQEAADDFMPPGNDVEDICRRECRMVEKADF